MHANFPKAHEKNNHCTGSIGNRSQFSVCLWELPYSVAVNQNSRLTIRYHILSPSAVPSARFVHLVTSYAKVYLDIQLSVAESRTDLDRFCANYTLSLWLLFYHQTSGKRNCWRSICVNGCKSSSKSVKCFGIQVGSSDVAKTRFWSVTRNN